MHMYVPVIVISKVSADKELIVVCTKKLSNCIFVAVTAYQNNEVCDIFSYKW